MTDPLALLPLALAAGGGTVDGRPAPQLVAAGLTLLQRSAPLVRALQRKRSAILIPTSSPFLTALAASDGRSAVLINPLAAPAEIEAQCADANVGAAFTVRALAGRLPPALPCVLLDDAPTTAVYSHEGIESVIDLGSHFPLAIEGERDVPGRDEEAAIVYTSAMAGRALGAILTHRNLLANARQTVEAAAYTADDHVLAVIPFSHLFGLTVTLSAPLVAGARVTTMDRFNPFKAIEAMESAGVTTFVGVPAVFAGMLAALERKGGRLESPSLRLCICGGAVLPVALQDRWAEATGVELRQGYGLTETAPVCLFNRVSLPNRRGTLGVPFPGCEVTVRDPVTSTALSPETEGEICVRGETVSPGYVSDSARGLQTRDGWFHSGDLGIAHADGTVSFTGLHKPMFTRNGFNVYPAEIERVVAELDGVWQVRCYAIPEPSRENDVGLEIVGTVTAEAVKAWCETRLSAYKQPSTIDVRAE
ncbi:MAG: AMP-binding protein [Gemmatimonadaceae bacterium]|nr:AMP-binding protein [Gemmatimonadaceae bacterium]